MSDTCPSVLWRCRLGAVRKYLVRVSDYSGRPMFDSLLYIYNIHGTYNYIFTCSPCLAIVLIYSTCTVLFFVPREFFHLLSKELVNPQYGLFQNANGLYRPSPQSSVHPNHLDYFNLCGKVLARMICDSKIFSLIYYTDVTVLVPQKPGQDIKGTANCVLSVRRRG